MSLFTLRSARAARATITPRRGATLIEFGLILALIAVVCIGAINALGPTVASNFQNTSDSFAGQTGGSGDGEPQLAVQTVCATQDESDPDMSPWGMYDPFTVETCLTMSEGAADEWGNANHSWAIATDFTADGGYTHYCQSVEIEAIDTASGGFYYFGEEWQEDPHTYGVASFVWDGATVTATCNHEILDSSMSLVASGTVTLNLVLASE